MTAPHALASRAERIAVPADDELAAFRIAGYDDERFRFTEPVEVRCGRCMATTRFGEFAGTEHDSGADLGALVSWARGHRCQPGQPAARRERRLVPARSGPE